MVSLLESVHQKYSTLRPYFHWFATYSGSFLLLSTCIHGDQFHYLKIASASIAARIKSVLTKLICEDQSRFIGDKIRLVYDIMYYTERNNIPGMIILLDFATAFESLSWNFMHNVLELFNFGPNNIQWIKMFYTNSVSCVTVYGNLSDCFEIRRGCRPLIFLSILYRF